MKNRTGIVVIVVLVLIVVAAFIVYSNPAISSALGLGHTAQTNTASTTPRRFNGDRGGFTTGTIESLNDSGFTITLQDGTTKNITTTATTTIQDFTSASSTPTTITSDQLSVGEQVRVIGATQSDGSISANRVLVGILPNFGGHGRVSQ